MNNNISMEMQEVKANSAVIDNVIWIENNNLYDVFNKEILNNYNVTVKVEETESVDYETDIIVLDPTVIKHKPESTNTQLYKDHIIKEELVIGPEQIQNNCTQTTTIQASKKKLSKTYYNNLYQCVKCKNNCTSKKDLNAHLKVVHNYKICNLCKKSFSKQSNLKRHQDYFCPKGDSIKINNEKLKYGMFSHPFICDYCKKSYTHKNTLITHIRSHVGGVRRYQCHLCEKSYTKKSNLTCHIQFKHFNIKRYSCKYCKRKYTWKWAASMHERTQH